LEKGYFPTDQLYIQRRLCCCWFYLEFRETNDITIQKLFNWFESKPYLLICRCAIFQLLILSAYSTTSKPIHEQQQQSKSEQPHVSIYNRCKITSHKTKRFFSISIEKLTISHNQINIISNSRTNYTNNSHSEINIWRMREKTYYSSTFRFSRSKPSEYKISQIHCTGTLNVKFVVVFLRGASTDFWTYDLGNRLRSTVENWGLKEALLELWNTAWYLGWAWLRIGLFWDWWAGPNWFQKIWDQNYN